MEKSNFAFKKYLEYWKKISDLFGVTSEQKAKEGFGILSALGRGRKFQSNEELETYIGENGVDGITFRLSYSYNLQIETEEKASAEIDEKCKSILRQYNKEGADWREAIDKIEKIVIRFNVSEILSNQISVLERIREKATALPDTFSRVLKIRRCIYQNSKKLTVKKNDRDGWGNVWTEIKDWLQNVRYPSVWDLRSYKQKLDGIDKETEFVIAEARVDVSNEDDISNLRYFLPLWHHIYRATEAKCKLALFSSEQQENSMLQRAGQLFSMSPAIQRIVTLNGKDLPHKMDIGGLFPIICFSAAENADGKANEQSSGQYYIEDPDTSGKYDKLLNGYFSFIVDKDNYKGNIGDNLYEKDKVKIRNSLLRFLLNKFKTSDGADDIKDLLRNNVFACEELTKRACVNNKFSTLLFLYLIRSYIANKTIIEKDEFGEWVLNEHIVDMAWTNAKTYAEGLLQLIENAQKHSKGHIAYFGMRIYKTDPKISAMHSLAEEAQKRKALWDKYRHNDKKKLSAIFNATEEGRAKYSDFVEFYVLDDAIDHAHKVYGVVDVIQKNNTIKKDVVDSIEKIFNLTEENYESKDSFYIEHYGMRWFKSHIERLNGVMEIYSPSAMCVNDTKGDKYKKACVYSSLISLSQINVNYRNLFATEYSVLVPLAYRSIEEEKIYKESVVEELFLPIAKVENAPFGKQLSVDLTKEIADYYNGHNKHDKVSAINELYQNKFKRILENNSDAILMVVKADSFGGPVGVEIVAKALFKLLYNNVVQDKNHTFYIAVVFNKAKDLAKEFIRIYSIFYGKRGNNDEYSNRYMENVQVAVCTDDDRTNRKTVNFVLAGKMMKEAYATAQKLVYYDAEASLDFVPLIKFLVNSDASNDDGSIREMPLFPFDLLLYDESEKNSWFELQMQHRLETDLRKSEYGCKISNVNVRLGSKIHIDTFYEAELLLHNVGTIKRFAYLLALDIVKELASQKDFLDKLKSGAAWLFLLGYENYSAVLMQEVQRIVKDYYTVKIMPQTDKSKIELNIEWMIDTRSEDFPVLSFDKFSIDKKQTIAEAKNKDIRCITILPLGSTMSTVYKLHDSFKRGLKRIKGPNDQEEFNDSFFCSNYCLVAIGNSFLKNRSEKEKLSDIDGAYISEVTRKNFDNERFWRVAKLRPNHSSSQQTVRLKYLLGVSGTWSDPYLPTDNRHNDRIPLLKVDKTSTLLDAHFQAPLKDEVLTYYKRASNIERLAPEEGKSYVKYGHILRGDNHYQFYFDFEKLTEKCMEEIKKWSQNVRKEIDTNAYNIVISPLQITNVSFLKILIDEAFGSNLHLLHIDILGTGKENVRKKFEYIAREFSEIKHRGIKINFYYVDDGVCTGNGLARAWKFLLTLCNQSGMNIGDIFPSGKKFTKVLLLVNRSSYETAQTWVNDPNKDWLGFINLCVPSYNTHMENNVVTCPGCRVYSRYDQLRKRSATNELVGYFAKHAKKHLVRNPQEYDLWLDDQILNSPSYFEWLREWVWFKKENAIATISDCICEFYKTNKTQWTKRTTKDFLNWLEGQSDSENKSNIRKDVLKTIKIIIAEDNYLRMRTMDKAYRELLYTDDDLRKTYEKCRSENTPNFTLYQSALHNKIISLLAGCFPKKKDNTENRESFEGKTQYDSIFEFISYIKVISRDYLAKNYFIREAMYKILCWLFEVMTMPKDELKSLVQKIESKELKLIIRNIRNIDANIGAEATLQYRIFKVITHRLALMRWDEMFQKDAIEMAYKSCNAMIGDEAGIDEEKKIFLALPSKEEMIISYLASIKTAVMEENDDAMCFALWQQAISQEMIGKGN